MITHIKIQDFAIIDHLDVDFHEGLNVITGETGAGKSIIIEAISTALGSRADTTYVRTGKDKAIIQLTLDTSDDRSQAFFEENGITPDEEAVIKREISKTGKSVCRINGEIVPVSLLSKFCRCLADIHGQYDHQSLLNAEQHVHLLDSFGGPEIRKVRETTEQVYHQYVDCSRQLNQLKNNLASAQRQRDFMSFELDEINNIKPVLGEDEELAQRITLLENSQRIFERLSGAYELLFGEERSILSQLNAVTNQLSDVAEFSSAISGFNDQVSDAYYQLEDASEELRRFKDNLTFSPEELEEAYKRQDLLDGLKRKHGGSLESVLAYAKEVEQALTKIDNADAEIEDLTRNLGIYRDQLKLASSRLSLLRHNAADLMSQKINAELLELNFQNAQFVVDFKEQEKTVYTANGIDVVEFLISTNKGETPKPLAKIASGGEISRIMLAMKRITGELDYIPTLIFDEIDSGISGITASIVGKKLVQIAENHQVMCITHLPQIAACGSHHYKIQKTDNDESTVSTVVPLTDDERVDEIARLLGGINITETTRESARELLALSK
ncbi:MAG: DNA repair protein RecN [Firmicutes bacterium]|nr:DNA repair protein RecN [Bacillota bacterium]MBR7147723.1 DNA repair protein RecN [Bacillota bacterium]